MTQKEGVEQILDGYRAEFEQGDYQGFFEAVLLCCWNSIPLPEWVCTLVIQQAEDAFNKRATGRGRTGNWRSQLNRLQIDRYRANHVDMHLRARRRLAASTSPAWPQWMATARRRTSIRARTRSRCRTSLNICRKHFGARHSKADRVRLRSPTRR